VVQLPTLLLFGLGVVLPAVVEPLAADVPVAPVVLGVAWGSGPDEPPQPASVRHPATAAAIRAVTSGRPGAGEIGAGEIGAGEIEKKVGMRRSGGNGTVT
jgi:hypothetical protein